MKQDWIAIVETGYHLGGSLETWLADLLTATSPLLDHGLPPVAWVHYAAPGTRRRLTFAAGVDPGQRHWIRLGHCGNDPRLYQLLYGAGRCVGTAHRDIFPALPGEEPKFHTVTACQVDDLLLAAGPSGNGATVCFAAYSKGRIRLDARVRKRWQRLGTHLGAGLRLRLAMHKLDPACATVEAVLAPDGRVQEVRGPSRDCTATRERLRRAVVQMDRCRSRRLEADEALTAWEALVAGRWSLIEHFDSDQRRFICAVRNDPLHPDPRGLNRRERQVAEYIGMGWSSGQIAYALGLARSSVTDCALRAQRKLGLRSWMELAAFFAANGPRARLAEAVVRGERLLIGTCPLLPEAALHGLTAAERDVLAALLAGSTNADIARRREVSDRTVANQVQAIYRKLGVRARGELAAQLLTDRG